jgi:hypothetical protein
MNDLTAHIRTEITAHLGSMARFAGWLGKGRSFDDTRAQVQVVTAAFDGRTDMGPSLLLLDDNLQRLPSSEVRKMLRKELDAILILLTTPSADDRIEPS